ncbi:MAG TPA: hypothetical protein PLZ57_03360 [Pseudobdellovibrionaceae bacterium]|nr:hypothetical protein [Pseudobdellovibrionaceae bacterium]
MLCRTQFQRIIGLFIFAIFGMLAGFLAGKSTAEAAGLPTEASITSRTQKFLLCTVEQQNLRIELDSRGEVSEVSRDGESLLVSEVTTIGDSTRITAVSLDPIGAYIISVNTEALVSAVSRELTVDVEIMGAPGTVNRQVSSTCAVFP